MDQVNEINYLINVLNSPAVDFNNFAIKNGYPLHTIIPSLKLPDVDTFKVLVANQTLNKLILTLRDAGTIALTYQQTLRQPSRNRSAIDEAKRNWESTRDELAMVLNELNSIV